MEKIVGWRFGTNLFLGGDFDCKGNILDTIRSRHQDIK